MSLSPEQIAAFAEQLANARTRQESIPAPTMSLGAVADAYRIQDAVVSRVGPTVGWKVGAKSPEAVPTCAPLLAGTVVPPDGNHTIAVGRSLIGVELEIAYRLGHAFSPRQGLPADDEIVAAIESAHIAVELCRSRFIEGPRAPALWLLADSQINHLLVLGPAIGDWRDFDSNPPRAHLAIDGKPVTERGSGHPAKGTLRLLAWLVRHAIEERGGLAAGSVVTTGSWTGLTWIEPPAAVRGGFAGHGQVTLQLSAEAPR